MTYRIDCSACGGEFASVDSGCCSKCGGRVQVLYDLDRVPASFAAAGCDMWDYRALLPVEADLSIITMGEGRTPLVISRTIGPALGIKQLYFKLETCNPTGSFKDRIASLMLSRYAHQGVATMLIITSGNAGSAVAAYAARARIRCIAVQMAEAPPSKRLQLHAYGALVVLLDGIKDSPGNLELAFTGLLEVGRSRGWPVSVMAHYYDPINVEAYKTISFEICDRLGDDPFDVYVPVGGGGLFAAMAKGFKEYAQLGRIAERPRMVVVQPAGASSVAAGFDQGQDDAVRVEPNTAVSGVGGAYSLDGSLIIDSLRATGGHCCGPTDEQTHQAQVRLAGEEGIFAEPAGALSVAGLINDVKEKGLDHDRPVVCVITGSGFKDQEAAQRLFNSKQTPMVHVREIEKIPSIVDAK